MTLTTIRARIRNSLRHRLMGLKHFVERHPALHRVAVGIVVRNPAVKLWLVRRMTQSQVQMTVTRSRTAATQAVPPIIASEAEHVSYLLRRAIDAKRRD